jgi:hypothetical protein
MEDFSQRPCRSCLIGPDIIGDGSKQITER